MAASLTVPSRRGPLHRLAEERREEYVKSARQCAEAKTASGTSTDALTSRWTGSMGTAKISTDERRAGPAVRQLIDEESA